MDPLTAIGLCWLVSISLGIVVAVPSVNRLPFPVALRRTLVHSFGLVLPLLLFFVLCVPFAMAGWRGFLNIAPWVPLVLWAGLAFHRAAILAPDEKAAAWVASGLLVGAALAASVLAFHRHCWSTTLLRAVPFWVIAAYLAFCARAVLRARPSLLRVLLQVLAAVPLWLLGFLRSREFLRAFHAEHSDCFVVTATLGGHRCVVGPLRAVRRNGRLRQASRQLATFWEFEVLWRQKSARSHALFRLVYNRVGPWFARRIRTRLVADAVHVLLKPPEWLARRVVRRYWRR